ncbi:ABC transporter substrate-binding protein [Pleionea sediminis]|uniref:ABC transporter substrate-binding protein n=1 Tax=Pleionea sediminis TaxID=2569479 RepID=UPI001185AA5C|nr:ABC transporter substrate-binding protein [Pleionea sediminis]
MRIFISQFIYFIPWTVFIVLLSSCAADNSKVQENDGTAKDTTTFPAEESSIKSLSIKELINIPLDQDYSKYQIYQSDTNQVAEDTVNYGLIVPISEFPVYSSEVVAAADSAASFINQHGGINGRRLVLLRADDHENTPVSAQLAERLANEFKVEALLGPATSDSVADVLKKVAIPQNIPIISHAASSMKLTEIGGQHAFWRMVANNNQQVQIMGDFLYQQQGHKKVFIISGRELYSREIRNGLLDYYKARNDALIDFLAISNRVLLPNMDMKDEIQAIQASGTTALVITLQNAQVIPMLEKIKAHWQGDFPLIVLGDNVTPKYLVDAQLGTISQCILTYVASPKELSTELKDTIMTLFDVDTSMFDAAYIFDATVIFAMAQTLAEQFDLSMREAVTIVADNGHPIDYKDFPNIVELYKKHKQFQFNGYSGRVHFNQQGENLSAYMKIYPIAANKLNPSCLQKQ